ncbi:hypothetical protein KDL28_00185 [Pseudonocardia sp. S2-4]|uniref:Integral membrane protein n=1 Tax=Pseudonocardia humida TaxID=2800819 RepID=A0ABT0ZRX0_9PSEU|nr:hypothetical protein [Pseudonocardia humida]MCO1653464.1 hypothetical protein [Pseudonocardia humida]
MPRRLSDRVEDFAAWLFIVTALLLVVVAAGVGGSVHRDGLARSAADSAQRKQVPAEVLADDRAVTARFRTVSARWAGPDGVPITGRIALERAAPAGRAGAPARAASTAPGRQVMIWVDDRGHPGPPPATAAQAVQAGVVAAVTLVLLGLVALGGGWLGVRAVVARSNGRHWEREWARVGPRWSGRVH